MHFLSIIQILHIYSFLIFFSSYLNTSLKWVYLGVLWNMSRQDRFSNGVAGNWVSGRLAGVISPEQVAARIRLCRSVWNLGSRHYILVHYDGILLKGPYLPCLRMADRTLLAGYPWLQGCHHYSDVIMSTMAFHIPSLMIVYSTVYSGRDQRKHQSSASLALVSGFPGDRWIPCTKG